MDFIKRTNAFLELGHRLKSMDQDVLTGIIEKANNQNPWFTPDNIRLSINGLTQYLEEEKFNTWLSRYDISGAQPKNIGVVMAGNIPLVGIHDFICVLASGNKLTAKLSSQDNTLIPFIANELIDINPEFEKEIEFVDQLTGIDAVIATGSDNTSRYFDFYFSKYPNIIRKNRTSIAVLTGKESEKELKELGRDIFSYFGLGCRNVSKLFLPSGYDLKEFIPHLNGYESLINHHKYANNFHYNRTIFLMNQAKHLDNGFALFQENEKLASPISVVYYEEYKDINSLKNDLIPISEKIQCIVSREPVIGEGIEFGKAQMPEIWDYADNIDTLEFLTNL